MTPAVANGADRPRRCSGSRRPNENSKSSAAHHAAKKKVLATHSSGMAKPPTSARTRARMKSKASNWVRLDLIGNMSCSAPRQRTDADEQAKQCNAQEIARVRQEQRPRGERPEVHKKRQVDNKRIERIWQQPTEMVDDPQQQEDAERQQCRDDLVAHHA